MIEQATSYVTYKTIADEVVMYQQATLFFCFLISLSIYLLLPKKIKRSTRISASVLIFLGLFGLFSILLKTLIRIIG